MSVVQVADYLDDAAELARQAVRDVLDVHAGARPVVAHNLIRGIVQQFLTGLERELLRRGAPGHLSEPMLAAVRASREWFRRHWLWAHSERRADPSKIGEQALATIDLCEFWAKDAAVVEMEAAL